MGKPPAARRGHLPGWERGWGARIDAHEGAAWQGTAPGGGRWRKVAHVLALQQGVQATRGTAFRNGRASQGGYRGSVRINAYEGISRRRAAPEGGRWWKVESEVGKGGGGVAYPRKAQCASETYDHLRDLGSYDELERTGGAGCFNFDRRKTESSENSVRAKMNICAVL